MADEEKKLLHIFVNSWEKLLFFRINSHFSMWVLKIFRWYAEKYVKGQWQNEECVVEWEKYRKCLSVSFFDLIFLFLLLGS